jgi:hypothetical protein
MARKDELMNEALSAFEESTGGTPDTREYVALEDAVNRYVEESADEKDKD